MNGYARINSTDVHGWSADRARDTIRHIRVNLCSLSVFIRSCILLLFILVTPVAEAQTMSGTAYQAKYGIVCLGGPGASSSTYALKNIIGANTGGMCGLAYCIVTGLNLFEDVSAEEDELLIKKLGALTSPGGGVIAEATWQNDNDPYFYWERPSAGIEVSGYSYSLDGAPDDVRDTTNTYYHFPEDSIADAVHTFYVKAQRTSGIWGDPAAFEIWVDTIAPSINNLTPELGSVVADELVEIAATLLDAASGIDPDTIEMKINQSSLMPAYDSASGRLSFRPSIPISDGEKIVSVKASDHAGNAAVPLAWSFIIDTEGPEGSVLINNDDESTNTNIVTLNISADDDTSNIAEMIFSNDGVFDTEIWEPYLSLRKNWALTPITGLRRVYARVKDEAGNISETFFDEINLVIIAPDTFILSGPSGVTQSQNASFTFRASLDNCQFSYKFDDEEWSDWSTDASAAKSGLAEGNHYFIVRSAKDLNKDGLLQLDEIDPTPALRVWTVSFSGTLKPPAQPEKPIKIREEQ